MKIEMLNHAIEILFCLVLQVVGVLGRRSIIDLPEPPLLLQTSLSLRSYLLPRHEAQDFAANHAKRATSATTAMMKASSRWLWLLGAAVLVSSAAAYTDDSSIECIPGTYQIRQREGYVNVRGRCERAWVLSPGLLLRRRSFGIPAPSVDGSRLFADGAPFVLSSVLRSDAGA